MLMTKRKPAGVGEILTEIHRAVGLTQAALAEAMGVLRKLVNELCNDRGLSPRRRRLFLRASSATVPDVFG